MQISLKHDMEAYLKQQVAAGRFNSIDEAIDVLVRGDEVMQAELDADDLSWAKPQIDEGLADLAAGRVVPAEDVHAELRHRYKTRD